MLTLGPQTCVWNWFTFEMADILEIFPSHSGLIVGTCWNNRRNTLYDLMRNTWFPLNCLWNQSVRTSRRNVTYIKRFVEVTIPKWCFFSSTVIYPYIPLWSYTIITIILYSHDTRFPLSKLPVVTAQGGGGSFKDRKPVGEVSCCDSWMAERTRWWTERWLRLWISLSLSLSVSLSSCLSLPIKSTKNI